MAGVAEAAAARGEMASGLAAGVETISQNQTVTFTRYVRYILPYDGYAYWLRADMLGASSVPNGGAFNAYTFNRSPNIASYAPTVDIQGSLHYASNAQQAEDESLDVNDVVFTSMTNIDDLNVSGPQVLYIGEIDGIQFAFSQRGMYYRQSGLFHYRGFAVYPALRSQLVDTVTGFDATSVVVSNSLPIWLTLNKFFPVYPSFLIPDNIDPPWCSVHIEPSQTNAMQATAFIDPNNGSTYQLCTDNVKLTVYGLRNAQILNFLNYVNDYSLNTDNFGIMNMPAVRDGKRIQTELNVLAMQKTIEFEINYYQAVVQNVALQYIKSVFINYYPQ